MNTITIVGNLTKDAVTRDAGSTTVTGFNVANNVGFGDRKQTLFFSCSMWGKRGQALEQYLYKGQQVVITGEMTTREYEGKTYMEINTNNVALVGGKSDPDPEQPRVYPGGDVPF